MSSRTSSVLLFFAALFGIFLQLVAGVPLETRDVYAPPILYPHAGTVWYKHQTHNVTWDVSDPPVNITNKFGRIMLRKGGIATPLILADGFDILLGRIEVQVPWVIDGSDYELVLFGDSGNWSQDFTIKQ
ncbi:hypothetical protein BV20DRAFT_965600 [Pilatotrama ljubarskyi]|nr:hypothetical protein BV20DRAFT_965600 [Pilatotrama ljubarskyi]